jgi:deferrochelatase/peroxidase EfeB
LRSAGVAGAAAAVGVGVERVASDSSSASGDSVRAAQARVPFFGVHQAGIATPSQGHVQFAAFDLSSGRLSDLRALLVAWSGAAARLTAGLPVGALESGEEPPGDTGESVGLGPARLTVTFGIGLSVFERREFGLVARRPAPLVALPAFAGEALDRGICGGDLGVQVCADDPQVAFHAIHNLIRIASPTAVPRWLLAGSGRTGNSSGEATPRNLMGFKDGTANIVAEDEEALARFVWANVPESPAWMRGGSYLVVRRIAMQLGAWDATSYVDQEQTFGRQKVSGAPLGGAREHDPLDLTAKANGVAVIPEDAHVRLASPSYNGGERLLRRGYSYFDGVEAGSPAGGLLFLCYQRDPRAQFIAIQHRLAASDALSRHVLHVGSAVFACPPGAAQGGFVGQGLFD